VRRKERKNIAHGHAHIRSTFNNTIVSITDPAGAVIAWASSGQVGFKGSRKSTPFAAQMAAEPPRAGRWSTACASRRLREGPGSGRETAIRSLQATGLEVARSRTSLLFRTTAAAREAAPGLRGKRQDGSIHRPGLQAVPAREDEALPQGRQVRLAEVRDRDPALPAGEHGRNRPRESEYLLQVREKQRARRVYGVLEKQFRNYYEEATRGRGKTGDNLLQILESASNNVVFRAGFAKSRDMARQLVKHGPHHRQRPEGRHTVVPGHQNDIIDVRAKSLEMTPFIIARAEAGERPVPAWLEVIPERMRILVHVLPVRAQIDTQVQEQLIVEYYSK